MNNKVLILVTGLFFINNSFAKSESRQMTSQPALLGGCGAPHFFTHYDRVAINEFIRNKNLKRIDISYPHNLTGLAKKIKNTLTKNSKAQVTAAEFNIEDTDDVSYRHDAVVVQACSR